MSNTISEQVSDYYGKVLQSKNGLKTSACCLPGSMPKHLQAILEDIADEIQDKFYGCGSPIPPAIEGATILDLGCGTGRDVYMLAKLVGPEGQVIGVDMTDEQLAVARKYEDEQAKRFGYQKPNTCFVKGYIEDLSTADIADNSVDVVISNCVINLSPRKEQVFKEIVRVLKPGGELYFSDVFADRRIPQELKEDPVLYGECLSGAMYTEDFRRMLSKFGIHDFRMVKQSPITLEDPEVIEKIGMVNFASITVRAYKIALEDASEDYGQDACYLGTIPYHEDIFSLDDDFVFPAGEPVPVCGNTADMILNSRLAEHFKISGDKSVHLGLFEFDDVEEGCCGEESSGCCGSHSHEESTGCCDSHAQTTKASSSGCCSGSDCC